MRTQTNTFYLRLFLTAILGIPVTGCYKDDFRKDSTDTSAPEDTAGFEISGEIFEDISEDEISLEVDTVEEEPTRSVCLDLDGDDHSVLAPIVIRMQKTMTVMKSTTTYTEEPRNSAIA